MEIPGSAFGIQYFFAATCGKVRNSLMNKDDSIEVYRKLEDEFNQLGLHRPMRFERYEAGTVLSYDITAIDSTHRARVHLTVKKFIGGGFAGQVYQVEITNIDSATGSIDGLQIGGVYAMKVLIPPSSFSLLFRNLLYWIGFQGPFQLQVNPAAARAGALWQKFIRRAAKAQFGTESAVVDIHATFVDKTLGSCGELSEWVEGRTWRLEVDDHLDELNRWAKGKETDPQKLGSPEYRAKLVFMRQFVKLLHQIGAHEFARQYEWSTWKSQPNCLKRSETQASLSDGLTAVDFRAGLALLPFLPMSPGDFKLILTGLMRGSLVQFDRGSTDKLKAFIKVHQDDFAGMDNMFAELEAAEETYRNSVPDITHNHFRLFYSPKLWSTMLRSAVAGWRVKNLINRQCRDNLHNSKSKTILFLMLGLIPIIGRFFRRIWGQPFWRAHYISLVKSTNYLRKAFRAKFIEKLINWHRDGRVDDANALAVAKNTWRCVYHWPLSLLPAGLHRLLTDWQFAKERLDYYLRRPVRLYFNNDLREQWLRDMVTEGQEKHLLSDEDAGVILSQIEEPYIQKYLKSLAVHVCTLPVTQVVSLMVALYFVAQNPQLGWKEALGLAGFILVAFQLTPISPGSLVRGFYVLYLVIKERNFRDYNIAVFLGFFKYIGYLAFPIQMTYRYPALARFMAGHWATEAVHVVPVFGESGALLEHKIFNLFYNWPLTIRRRMRRRSEIRAKLQPRYWHFFLCTIVATGLFSFYDWVYLDRFGNLPGLKVIWAWAVIVPLLIGVITTLGAGGAPLWRRITGAALCSVMVGLFSALPAGLWGANEPIRFSIITIISVWRAFVFTIVSVLGVLMTEIIIPEPKE